MFNDDAIWKNLNSPRRLFLIAGPCVIESEKLCLQTAAALKKTCAALGIFYVFKASFDKANRTSGKSFRGIGLERGLEILGKVRAEFGVPVLTDVHTETHAAIAGEVVDILQIPAFLCRQTDLIEAAAITGQIVNIKKGQFLSPAEMGQVVDKARARGREKNPAHRARHDVRLQQSRGRHALDSHHADVPAARWCSTRRIRCSCPAAAGTNPAGSGNSRRCWRARRWRRARTACSSRRIRGRTRR